MSDFNDPGNPNNQFFNGGNGEPFQSNNQQYQQNPYTQNPQGPQSPQTQQYGQPYDQQTAYGQPQQPQSQSQQGQQQAYGWQQTTNGQPQYAQYQQPNQSSYDQQAYDQYAYRQMPNPQPVPQTAYWPEQKSKLAAGLLGIFVGALGVHNFYLGNTGKAVAQLLLTLIGWIVVIGPAIAGIWGLIEGILILCSSYGSSWHRDGRGIELRD